MNDFWTFRPQPNDTEVWVLVYEQAGETGINPRWVTLASREAVADSCSEINLIARYRIPLAPGPDHWRDEAATPIVQAKIERLQKLVKAAYEEGFQTGLMETDKLASPDWSTSFVREALTGSSQ